MSPEITAEVEVLAEVIPVLGITGGGILLFCLGQFRRATSLVAAAFVASWLFGVVAEDWGSESLAMIAERVAVRAVVIRCAPDGTSPTPEECVP